MSLCLISAGDICSAGGDVKSLKAPEIIDATDNNLNTNFESTEFRKFRIKDFNSKVKYVLQPELGTVSEIDSNGYFIYKAPAVSESDNEITDLLKIYYKAYAIQSDTNTYNFDVKYVAMVSDQIFSNTDFASNQQSETGFTTDYIATADGATYIENPITQDDGDTDWVKVSDTTIYYQTNQIRMLSGSTDSHIISPDSVTDGENILLIDNQSNILQKTVSNVQSISTVNSTDPFNDGSCLSLYKLDKNFTDSCGGSDIIWHKGVWSSPTWEDSSSCAYTPCLTLSTNNNDGSGYITVPLHTVTSFTFSFYFYEVDHAGVIDRTIFSSNGNTITNSGNTLTFNFGGTSIDVPNLLMQAGMTLIITYEADTKKFVVYAKNFAGIKTLVDTTLTNPIQLGTSCDLISVSAYDIIVDQIRLFNRYLNDAEATVIANEKKYEFDIDNTAGIQALYLGGGIKVYMDMENDESSLDIDNNGVELPENTTTYDSTKQAFCTTFDALVKQGRALQRKIVANKGTKLITPFESQLWKAE